jgi:hypothetical protein
LGQFSRNYRTFYQKFFKKLAKIWVWDPRSGIRKKPIPEPGSGSRGQKGTGTLILDPDPQHCKHDLIVDSLQCCGSRMFVPDQNFSTPDPGSRRFRIPDQDPHQRIKAFLTQKIVSELSEI